MACGCDGLAERRLAELSASSQGGKSSRVESVKAPTCAVDDAANADAHLEQRCAGVFIAAGHEKVTARQLDHGQWPCMYHVHVPCMSMHAMLYHACMSMHVHVHAWCTMLYM
jgi:hypothetical protein